MMHLYHGRPLCSLPLSPFHVSHADINGDGVVDHVAAVNNPGQGVYVGKLNNSVSLTNSKLTESSLL